MLNLFALAMFAVADSISIEGRLTEIPGKMADKSKGNVGEFKAKAKHKLKLVPLEGNWDGAVDGRNLKDEKTDESRNLFSLAFPLYPAFFPFTLHF